MRIYIHNSTVGETCLVCILVVLIKREFNKCDKI